jgi:hypothetical protein
MPDVVWHVADDVASIKQSSIQVSKHRRVHAQRCIVHPISIPQHLTGIGFGNLERYPGSLDYGGQLPFPPWPTLPIPALPHPPHPPQPYLTLPYHLWLGQSMSPNHRTSPTLSCLVMHIYQVQVARSSGRTLGFLLSTPKFELTTPRYHFRSTAFHCGTGTLSSSTLHSNIESHGGRRTHQGARRGSDP